MFENIMVCLDGSKLAEQILPYAVEKAACHRGRLILFRAVPEPVVASPGVPGGVPPEVVLAPMLEENKAALAEARTYLDTTASQLRKQGCKIDILTASGNTGSTILSTADEHNVKLIMLTTHGHTGLRRVFGGVADYIIRESGLPVFVMKPKQRRTAAQPCFKNLLVCLDGSRLAEQALPFATDDALSCKSKLVLVQVVSITAAIPPTVEPVVAYSAENVEEQFARLEHEAQVYLSSAEHILKGRGIESETVVLQGSTPGEIILDYAEKHKIDQIMLATHGRGGLGRVLIGSVADYVLRESKLPVLVIRPRG